jgi:transposase
MTLREAVIKVIEQNELMGYHPEIFIFQAKRGEAKDLSWRVGNFVMSETAMEAVLGAIEKYGDILTIEDLIVEDRDSFGLPQETIVKAKENFESGILKTIQWYLNKYNK